MPNDQNEPIDGLIETREKDQGLLIDCIHCTILYRGTERKKCPECMGAKSYFVPAQMMDKNSSQTMIITEIITFIKEQSNFLLVNTKIESLTTDDIKKVRREYFNLLKKLIIYQFDLQEYIKNSILQLDERLNLSGELPD